MRGGGQDVVGVGEARQALCIAEMSWPLTLARVSLFFITLLLVGYSLHLFSGGAKPNQVEIYRTPEGRAPFVEWIESLKDLKTINLLPKRLGLLLQGNMGDFKFF